MSAAVSVEFSHVPLSDLSVGSVLTSPVFDVGGERTKLLGEGIAINEGFIKQLKSRGISTVSISKRDMATMAAGVPQGTRRVATDHTYSRTELATPHTEAVDKEVDSSGFKTEVEKQVERTIHTPTQSYDSEAVVAAVDKREEQISYVDDLFGQLIKGDGSGTESLTDVCRESIEAIARDKDLFSCLGINPYDGDYPSRHCLHVSSVAISIGFVLGMDDRSLIDLGTGCLIHDVGMLKIGSQLYRSKKKLNEKELSILAEHPVLTMDAISCSSARISPVAKVVAYQIHERCNGSGYPRGTNGDQLHVLSKIAAVADAYVALLSNRWHRPGMVPYYAMEKMLKDIPTGLFDPKAVRGLLQAVSLFPLGSFVETDDGRIGRVVRATGETYMQPIIEFWNQKHRQYEPDLVNLTEETDIKIKRALVTPKVEE
jgi:HD-GYP domain-containing protein (c-di-GMP phosphodiesterase class II)